MGVGDRSMAGCLTGRLPDPAFWQAKRVLLTGHTGFKGAWLALWLRRLGAQVTGLALPAEPSSLGDVAEIEQQVNTIRGDIRDLGVVKDAVRAADPHIVFHLAAQSLVRLSYQNPIDTIATNVLGTAHILEAVREAPQAMAFVSVTSDKCYENREWAWPYRETDALGGHDPYSASKACAELITATWRNSFLSADRPGRPFLAVASVRAGNVIGGGDWAQDRLVPDCIRAFIAGEPVQIRHPRATRPWQHVLEPLCGYLLLAEQLSTSGREFARAWNFGPSVDDIQPVQQIVERLASAWGATATWRVAEGFHAHEATSLAVDSTLARLHLGWHPRLPLPDALTWTASWYKQYDSGMNARALVEADITRYDSLRPSQ